MNLPSPLRSKFILLPAAAAVCFAALRLAAQNDPATVENELRILFPGNIKVLCDKATFIDALTYAKDVSATGKKKLHYIEWTEIAGDQPDKIPGGLDNPPKLQTVATTSASPAAQTEGRAAHVAQTVDSTSTQSGEKRDAIHVAQMVAFDSMKELTAFIEKVKTPPVGSAGKGKEDAQ